MGRVLRLIQLPGGGVRKKLIDIDPTQAARAKIEECAKLEPLDYALVREQAAKVVGLRVSDLDKFVEAERRKAGSGNRVPADGLAWPDPVEGAALVAEIRSHILRHVVMAPEAATASALWVLHAHAHEAAQHSPLLTIISPAKRCGKSTLLRVLVRLTPEPMATSNTTGPAIFRAVEENKPTLIIDEADSFMKRYPEVRNVLNSGHERSMAFVMRVDGKPPEAKRFSTWCPKAVAGIGTLDDTLMDRSIVVELQRRATDQAVKRLAPTEQGDEYETTVRKCVRWTDDNLAALRKIRPELPEGVNDRACDNWRPLLAIAERCGPEVLAETTAAMVTLSATVEDQDVGTMLLEDMRTLFAEHGFETIETKDLLRDLVEMDERPWGEYRFGKAMSSTAMAALLKRFGVKPDKWRRESFGWGRGYRVEDFRPAWAKYLPEVATPATPDTVATPNSRSEFFQDPQD